MDDQTLSYKHVYMHLETADQAEKICQELGTRHWKKLNLEGLTIGSEAAQRIGKELAKQPFLREAHFQYIFVGQGEEDRSIALDHLLTGISESGTELTLLDLSLNTIGPTGTQAFYKFLGTKAARKIERLYLDHCNLGHEDSSLIAVPISELRLKEFDFGYNRLGNKDAASMFAALREMDSLEVLKLQHNSIQVEGLTLILNVLMKNVNTIREIDLSGNNFQAKEVKVLAKVIMQAKNLKCLHLKSVLLDNRGFSIICDAISESNFAKETLRDASFAHNNLKGQEVIDLVARTFTGFNRRFSLNLRDNEFTRNELTTLMKLRDQLNISIDYPKKMDEKSDEGNNGGSPAECISLLAPQHC